KNGNCSAETVANGYSRDTTLISIRLLNQSDGGFT
ncbi:TPA: minor curlin subunit CsgB, partial [Escherichia coli]|nr:minor curlin subunit CsgB [Escherichia coli]